MTPRWYASHPLPAPTTMKYNDLTRKEAIVLLEMKEAELKALTRAYDDIKPEYGKYADTIRFEAYEIWRDKRFGQQRKN